MGQPVLGYPDFTRRTPMADDILINDNHTGATSTVTYPLIYVANIPAVWMFLSTTLLGARLIFNWYVDPGGTNRLGQSIFDVPVGGNGNHSFRPIAPYLQIQVVPSAGTGLNYLLILSAMYEVNTSIISPGYANLINVVGGNVNANTSVDVASPACRICPATWAWASNATSFSFELRRLDYQGNPTTIDRVDSLNLGSTPRPVFLGGGQPVIHVTNNDGVARTYHIFLNASTNIP